MPTPTAPALAGRVRDVAGPLGAVDVSATRAGRVLLDQRHDGAPATTGRAPLWNLWCASKPPVACAALSLLDAAGIEPWRPLHEYVELVDGVPDPQLTVAAILRHESRLPRLDPIDVLLLPGPQRRERLVGCLRADARRPAPVAAYSPVLGWWLLLAAVGAAHGTDHPDALVQAELDAAGHPDVVVAVTGARTHAGIEDRLALHTAGDHRHARAQVHDRAEAVVVGASAALRGFASTVALRRWYEDLGATLAGTRPDRRPGFPSAATLHRLLGSPRTAHDEALRRRCSFAAGFMVDLAGHHFGDALSSRAVGHAGWLGLSAGFVDPEQGLAVAAVHQRCGPPEAVSAVRAGLTSTLAAA